MKRFLVYETESGLGRYVSTASTESNVFTLPGMSVIELAPDADPDVMNSRVAVVDGELVEIPVRPSVKHIWSSGSWIDPTPESERVAAAWRAARANRTKLLRDSDWITVSDSPVTGTQRANWLTYRQALRDITKQPDPFNLVWPTPPA